MTNDPPDSRRSPKCDHLFFGVYRYFIINIVITFPVILLMNKQTDKRRLSQFLGGGRVTDCA